MVKRTLQYANGSYFTVIPAALIDSVGLKSGDKVSFSIENRKIVVAPVLETAKLPELTQTSTQALTMEAGNV